MPSVVDPSPPQDVNITINGEHSDKSTKETNRMWRDSSYDFTNDTVMKVAADSKDFELVDESPRLSRIPESTSVRNGASFREGGQQANAEQEEVYVRSSSRESWKKPSFLLTKTKSRLFDPPEEHAAGTPRVAMSQLLGKSEIDEDDPFLDEDLPEYYTKMRFSVLSVMQLLSLVLIIGALVCSLTINVLKNKTVLGLDLWKWELMVLILISGRLVSGWVIRIVVFFIERNFLLRKHVLYFVYGLRNAVQNCIWWALVLIAWMSIFDNTVEEVTRNQILPYVSKIWVCLLVGTVVWLFKALLVNVLASSFHVSAFFDRVHEALFNQYVIETLSGPPLVMTRREEAEESEVRKFQSANVSVPADITLSGRIIGTSSGRIIGATPATVSAGAKSRSFLRGSSLKKEEANGISVDHLHRLNQKNISAWNMSRLINIVREGPISTLDENIQGSTMEGDAMVQITTESHAKAAARSIFVNVAKPRSKYIYKEDLLRFVQEDEALKIIRLCDGLSDQKRISKRALKDWVVNAFRERRALALSLNDTKSAVNNLHQMFNVLVAVLIVVIWLLILRVATTQFFFVTGSQVLLVGFMFSNTCKTTFEAIIFLFVVHPFDVGDRIEIDGVHMVVEEMNILTTVLLKYDNHKIYYPNSVLSTKPIYNYYRSPDMLEMIDFAIHISTPVEKISVMKEKITSYCVSKSDHWYPNPTIVMRELEDMNRLKWSIWVNQRMNFQDMGERYVRRSLLVEEMIKIFRALDIEYRMLAQDVNVRNLPPIQSNRVPSNWTVGAAS